MTRDISENTIKITTIIPTLNEQENIEHAIQSVLFTDEIIIIDSYSSDKTLEIAQNYPVTILKRHFDDFSSQKNYALQHATNHWILFLDADERIPEALQKEILSLLSLEPKEKVFRFKMDYYFLGKKMRFGGFQSKYVFRLFHKKHAHFEGTVHEKLVAEGKFLTLQNHIVHQNLQGIDEFIRTQEQYAYLKALNKVNTPAQFNFLLKYIKATYRFLFHYLIRFGFLDGYAGYKFAEIQAYGMLKKYDIHTDLQHQKSDIEKSVTYLQNQNVILYPTDTVWGLGCDATDEKAVKKIFDIKQRNESKSLVILVSSFEMLQHYVHDISDTVKNIVQTAQKPITVIFDNAKGLAPNVIASDGTVAIRIASDDFCKNLIQKFGKPMVSTSANISGESTPQNFSEITLSIKNQVAYVVRYRQDDTSIQSPSAIIKVLPNNDIQVLR